MSCKLSLVAERTGLRPFGIVGVDETWSAFRLRPYAGADPNLVDELSYSTAIGLATDGGHLETVKLLLAAGADPTLDGGWQHSALDVARRNAGNPELLECLEEATRRRGLAQGAGRGVRSRSQPER